MKLSTLYILYCSCTLVLSFSIELKRWQEGPLVSREQQYINSDRVEEYENPKTTGSGSPLEDEVGSELNSPGAAFNSHTNYTKAITFLRNKDNLLYTGALYFGNPVQGNSFGNFLFDLNTKVTSVTSTSCPTCESHYYNETYSSTARNTTSTISQLIYNEG